jgi:hypothetical protein
VPIALEESLSLSCNQESCVLVVFAAGGMMVPVDALLCLARLLISTWQLVTHNSGIPQPPEKGDSQQLVALSEAMWSLPCAGMYLP